MLLIYRSEFQQIEKSFSLFLGANRVIVSTWSQDADEYNLYIFNLKALDPSHGIFSILCEKGKYFKDIQIFNFSPPINYSRIKYEVLKCIQRISSFFKLTNCLNAKELLRVGLHGVCLLLKISWRLYKWSGSW